MEDFINYNRKNIRKFCLKLSIGIREQDKFIRIENGLMGKIFRYGLTPTKLKTNRSRFFLHLYQ